MLVKSGLTHDVSIYQSVSERGLGKSIIVSMKRCVRSCCSSTFAMMWKVQRIELDTSTAYRNTGTKNMNHSRREFGTGLGAELD